MWSWQGCTTSTPLREALTELRAKTCGKLVVCLLQGSMQLHVFLCPGFLRCCSFVEGFRPALKAQGFSCGPRRARSCRLVQCHCIDLGLWFAPLPCCS